MDSTVSRTPVGSVTAPAHEPFDGFDAVLSGDPAARVAWLRTTSAGDGMLLAGMFTAEPSIFRYSFAGDETFHVLDGDLDVAVDGGDAVTLGPGDIVSFPKGSTSTWTVRAALRKFFVVSG